MIEYTTIEKFGVDYAYQGYIYLNKNTVLLWNVISM